MRLKYYSRGLLLIVVSILLGQNVFAQTQFKLPSGLGFANQLEYSYDVDKKLEIFENWLNLDFRKSIFSAGIRLDVFQPNDPNPSISRGKDRYADISFKYFGVKLGNAREGLNITVGNFYELFGRGMVLKSYEDRNIRIDNNLLGVKVEGSYAKFKLTALTGMAENMSAERNDILHAADLEYRGFKPIKMGASFASNQPKGDEARTHLAAVRIEPSIWNFDFYGEYGIKQNEDIKENIFNGDESLAGKAFYGSMNFYLTSFSFSGEYKFYDNYSFTSSDGTIAYNTPPALRSDYSYMLLNRHPSALNPNNEKGFQVEASYSLSEHTNFTANYAETKTLSSRSLYQRIRKIQTNSSSFLPIQTQLKQFFGQAQHKWTESLTTIAAFGYSEELSGNTKSITPILENRIYLDDINSFKIVLEHQLTNNRTTSEQYYDSVLLLEYLRSPKLSIALVTEMETREPEEGRIVRKIYSFVQVGYKFGQHMDVSILVGSRQAGNICIGGVCRFEPEFSGVELKMQTRLF
jgi:hypothetical protein